MIDEISQRDSMMRPLDGLHCFLKSQKAVSSMHDLDCGCSSISCLREALSFMAPFFAGHAQWEKWSDAL